MKKLTDHFITSVDKKIGKYAKKVEEFTSPNYHPDSKEGKKLWDIYFRLLNLEYKAAQSKEIKEKHSSLCNKILKKLPKII